MAAGRKKLVSYIKYYWDKKWKDHPHLLLILCGSVASWMVKNIVKSTALYGRISENILVEPLRPFEVSQFISEKRGRQEILEYLICFGGIPKYMEEFNFNQSIHINIERACFHKSGFFFTEAEKIFYSQFKETHLYLQIVRHLLTGPLGLNEIAQKTKMRSGGGLKQYLENLVFAGIIEKSYPLMNFRLAKTPRYVVIDEFLRFHEQFIKPHEDEINRSYRYGRFEKFTRGTWFPFIGIAFERFCLRNRYLIAGLLGFGEKVVGCGQAAQKGKQGFQYDLVYLRNDGVITLCEIKYRSQAIETSVIREMETKLKWTPFPMGVAVERVLISNQEASHALQESGYFHRIVKADEIIES